MLFFHIVSTVLFGCEESAVPNSPTPLRKTDQSGELCAVYIINVLTVPCVRRCFDLIRNHGILSVQESLNRELTCTKHRITFIGDVGITSGAGITLKTKINERTLL